MSTKYPQRFYGDKKYGCCCVYVYILIARQWHTHTHTHMHPHTHTFASRPKLVKKWKSVACHNSHSGTTLWKKSTLQNDSLCGIKLPPYAGVWLSVPPPISTATSVSTSIFHTHPPPPCQTKWQAVKVHVSFLPPTYHLSLCSPSFQRIFSCFSLNFNMNMFLITFPPLLLCFFLVIIHTFNWVTSISEYIFNAAV